MCALAIWVIYFAMHTGVPAKPAANVARLAPGFEARMSIVALGIATVGTVASSQTSALDALAYDVALGWSGSARCEVGARSADRFCPVEQFFDVARKERVRLAETRGAWETSRRHVERVVAVHGAGSSHSG